MRAKIVRILSNVEETEKKNKIKYQGKKARPSARKIRLNQEFSAFRVMVQG